MRRLLGLVAVTLLTGATWVSGIQASTDEILVIVNKDNPNRSLARDELRPFFQTTKTQWSDSKRAAPFNLPDDDTTRREFDTAVLRLDPERVARYWVDRKIRGGERPPVKLPGVAAMLRAVAANGGGIGYVRAGDANATVKIIARVRQGEVLPP
jgi:ABC-type phosphate transport system substrate-binding protein